MLVDHSNGGHMDIAQGSADLVGKALIAVGVIILLATIFEIVLRRKSRQNFKGDIPSLTGKGRSHEELMGGLRRYHSKPGNSPDTPDESVALASTDAPSTFAERARQSAVDSYRSDICPPEITLRSFLQSGSPLVTTVQIRHIRSCHTCQEKLLKFEKTSDK